MKSVMYLVLLALMLGCDSGKDKDEACIDPAKIDPQGICTKQYDPVCGCDGKTYGNACEAEKAGLTSWEKGECPEES